MVESATIEVGGLRKHYGATLALDDMTFTVAPGEVCGFVGPNGAGKSTTMRVILGLDSVSSGTALVSGQRYVSLASPLCVVGALLDASAVAPNRSGRNHLLWMAHSHGFGGRRVEEVLALVGLESAGRRKAGGYSLGMRQRLGIAAAMLGDPPILLMDEPFNGMDPEGIVWMRALLRGLAAEGRAVLISSHLMSELEDVADHLVVIGRGRVVADTTVTELVAAMSGDTVVVRTRTVDAALRALAAAGASASAMGADALAVSGLAAERIVAVLGGAGVAFSEVSAHRATLEEAYLALTRDAVEFHGAARR
jgi:ABC-2 type transport system ATP-binding protein